MPGQCDTCVGGTAPDLGTEYSYYGGPSSIGPMVYIKTKIFKDFYLQYLVYGPP